VTCIRPIQQTLEPVLYKDALLIGFATLAGLAASGILANLYRLVAKKPQTSVGKLGHVAIMIVAGPSVLFENATSAFRKHDCSTFTFWLATAIATYWSFAIGLLMIQVWLALH
jgi:hypothetical protein